MESNEAFFTSAGTRAEANYDDDTATSIMVFWIFFAVVILVIGINGMVAFMTVSLKIGTREERHAYREHVPCVSWSILNKTL